MSGSDDYEIDRARAGDRVALGSLLRKHAEAILRHTDAKIGLAWRGRLTPEDVLQTVCIDAMRDVFRFEPRGDGAFLQWLKRIADRNIIDAIRGLEAESRNFPKANPVRFGHQMDASESFVQVLFGVSGPSLLSRNVSRDETVRLLAWALAQLPEENRLVVERYHLQGWPIASIAREIGRTEGATYMIRTRTIERLGVLLAKKVSQIFTNP